VLGWGPLLEDRAAGCKVIALLSEDMNGCREISRFFTELRSLGSNASHFT
jgi:hypothetical protein